MFRVLWLVIREIVLSIAAAILFFIGFFIGVFRFAFLVFLCFTVIGSLSSYFFDESE